MPQDLLEQLIDDAPAASAPPQSAPRTAAPSLDDFLNDVPDVPAGKQSTGTVPALPLAPYHLPQALRPDNAPVDAGPTMGMYGVPLPAPPPSMQIDPAKIAKQSVANQGKILAATAPMIRNNPELGGSIAAPPPTIEGNPETGENSDIHNFGEAMNTPAL